MPDVGVRELKTHASEIVRQGGSDAVYAVVFLRFGSTLVTLDREQQERLASVITACRPDKALDDLV